MMNEFSIENADTHPSILATNQQPIEISSPLRRPTQGWPCKSKRHGIEAKKT